MSTNITKLKLAALRKMGEEDKVKGWEEMTRQQLIKALKPLLKVKVKIESDEADSNEEPGEKESPVEAPKVETAGVAEGHVPVGSKAEKMREALSKQRKVRILIPLEAKEKAGSTESVILNGYRLNIQKGVYVDVPSQVADVIMEANNQTQKALDHPLKLSGDESALKG